MYGVDLPKYTSFLCCNSYHEVQDSTPKKVYGVFLAVEKYQDYTLN
jgi:hypothetical protein